MSAFPRLGFYPVVADEYGPQYIRCDLEPCADLSCATSRNAFTTRVGDISGCPSGAGGSKSAACPGDGSVLRAPDGSPLEAIPVAGAAQEAFIVVDHQVVTLGRHRGQRLDGSRVDPLELVVAYDIE